MGWLNQDLPNWIQWLGLIGTLLGALLSLGSFFAAIYAASRARDARQQATLAKLAATRLGRVTQLGDLIGDMQELQTMLARADFPAIAAKCQHLRGRVVRFKTEAYTELGDEENENLDRARGHLEIIAREAAVGKARETSRLGRIQLGYGHANEALNKVIAMHGHTAQGE